MYVNFISVVVFQVARVHTSGKMFPYSWLHQWMEHVSFQPGCNGYFCFSSKVQGSTEVTVG